MTLSDLEWLSKLFTDRKRRAVSLQQLSFLFFWGGVQAPSYTSLFSAPRPLLIEILNTPLPPDITQGLCFFLPREAICMAQTSLSFFITPDRTQHKNKNTTVNKWIKHKAQKNKMRTRIKRGWQNETKPGQNVCSSVTRRYGIVSKRLNTSSNFFNFGYSKFFRAKCCGNIPTGGVRCRG